MSIATRRAEEDMIPAIEQDQQALVDRHVTEVARSMSPRELGEEMGDHLIAAIPEFPDASDDDFRAGIVMSCTSNLNEIIAQLLSGAPDQQVTPPADAIAWAHELVHRGMPLAALLRAYRLGHGLFEQTFERMALDVEMKPDLRWRVLASASRYVFTYIDTVCTQLVQDYEDERAHWIRGAAAAQAELVHAIIEGEDVEPQAATATLRYDVTAEHLAFIVWNDPRVRRIGQNASLVSAAKAIGVELGGTTALLIPIGENIVWGWVSGKSLVAQPPRRLSAPGDGIGVAVGSAQPGLQGMFRSHHEARAARRVGEIFRFRPGTVTTYQAVALASLITADPAQAARFAETELGELCGDADALRRLRATLSIYMEENVSPSRTARRLSIHQNTVVYRVKRAEEILGRPLTERRLELELALRLYAGLEGLREAQRDASS